MAKAKERELTVIEAGFIESKRHLTPKEIHATYFVDSGVNEDKIAAVLESLPAEDKSEEKAKKRNAYDKEKTAEENRMALARSEMSAGNQMIRDKDRKGIAIMTEASSELADARRAYSPPAPVDNSGHIHRINKAKK